jgi:uncharacterized protein (DUF1778 family)
MTSSVLSVCVSSEERALLEAASGDAHTSLSDVVRRRALEAAEVDFLERRVVTIPARDWEAFESWVERPAEELPGLRRLAGLPPTWQD